MARARPPARLFLLSPARCSGERMQLLLRPQAAFDLARELRSPAGAPLGRVFEFASGLYFRGKLAYARAFARPPRGVPGALVIAPGAGLVPADQPVRPADVHAFAAVDVDPDDARFRGPLERDARLLAEALRPRDEVVLLGSVASDKYLQVLLPRLPNLLFPPSFVGRGDMSRGGLLLRCSREGRELDYAPVAGAARHGPRPPRLPRLPRPVTAPPGRRA